jgi:hypothetical protein
MPQALKSLRQLSDLVGVSETPPTIIIANAQCMARHARSKRTLTMSNLNGRSSGHFRRELSHKSRMSLADRANLRGNHFNVKAILIPASLPVLTRHFFANAQSVEIVELEASSPWSSVVSPRLCLHPSKRVDIQTILSELRGSSNPQSEASSSASLITSRAMGTGGSFCFRAESIRRLASSMRNHSVRNVGHSFGPEFVSY